MAKRIQRGSNEPSETKSMGELQLVRVCVVCKETITSVPYHCFGRAKQECVCSRSCYDRHQNRHAPHVLKSRT